MIFSKVCCNQTVKYLKCINSWLVLLRSTQLECYVNCPTRICFTLFLKRAAIQPSDTDQWRWNSMLLLPGQKMKIPLFDGVLFRFEHTRLDAARRLVAGRALKRNPRFKCSSARYVQLQFFFLFVFFPTREDANDLLALFRFKTNHISHCHWFEKDDGGQNIGSTLFIISGGEQWWRVSSEQAVLILRLICWRVSHDSSSLLIHSRTRCCNCWPARGKRSMAPHHHLTAFQTVFI